MIGFGSSGTNDIYYRRLNMYGCCDIRLIQVMAGGIPNNNTIYTHEGKL